MYLYADTGWCRNVSRSGGSVSECNRVIHNTNRDGVGAMRRRQHGTVSATTLTPLTLNNKGGNTSSHECGRANQSRTQAQRPWVGSVIRNALSVGQRRTSTLKRWSVEAMTSIFVRPGRRCQTCDRRRKAALSARGDSP